MIYSAKDNERLDKIVYNHYGSLKHFEQVLAINPKLSPKLSAGDKVVLPEFKETLESVKLKSLW